MTVTLLRGDALALPLADHSVDLVVTSPPYFGLRSYQDGGEHYAGQIGSEATPAEWVDAMLAATAEMVRVLKPCGSIWVNLGDKYASTSAAGNNNGTGGSTLGHHKGGGGPHSEKLSAVSRPRRITPAAPPKSLIGLPWRYAIACIDQLGLILRAEVIWSKPNGLPESVTDRVRRSHEQWFHFTKQPRYFAAVDEIREAYSPQTDAWRALKARRAGEIPAYTANTDQVLGGGHTGLNDLGRGNPLGKLPGSVWSIPSQPLAVPPELGVDHFAAFPMEWPRRLIAGWSPAGICVGCGEGRRPVAERDPIDPRHLASNSRQESHERLSIRGVSSSSILRTGLQSGQSPATHITRYACTCCTCEGSMRDGLHLDSCRMLNATTRPSVCLDPFGGTGTTALVAHVMGRHGISVDMSADYTRLAAWRTTDPGELAKAAQVEKPAAQVSGQDHLFHLEGA